MKKIAVFALMIALLAIGASALQITSPTLGDSRQDRVSNVVSSFTITNNESATLTGISLAFTQGAEASKYNLQYSSLPSSLGPGATATVTVNGTIPLDHPGVDSNDLKEKALKIGAVQVSGTVNSATDSATADINMQAVNQLRIKKARVDCDSTAKSVDDGDEIKNLKPGTSCTLEVEIENNFDNDDRNNQKIGDIEFRTVDTNIDSDDSDVDIDEGNEVDDLGADDSDITTADIQIEDDAKDGTNRIDIRVTAIDENGALHGEALTFRLKIDRLTHDITIRRIELGQSSIDSCQERNMLTTVSILNLGKRNEDEVAVEVSIPDLQISDKESDIELDEDDSTSVQLALPIKADTKPGLYRVDVKTFFDNIAQSNVGTADLNILECEEEEEPVVVNEEPQTTTTVVVPQGSQGQVAAQAQAAPRRSESTSFTDSKAYVALLSVLIVLILIAIIAMGTMLWKKRH